MGEKSYAGRPLGKVEDLVGAGVPCLTGVRPRQRAGFVRRRRHDSSRLIMRMARPDTASDHASLPYASW